MSAYMDPYAPKKKTIAPFDKSRAQEPDAVDLEQSGHAILALLEDAAQVARMNEEHATGIAQRLSKELEAAVERTRQIEAEVRRYEDRAFRAEKWVQRVYKEVAEKFSNQKAANTGQITQR